jgi:hypothetical protein
MKKLVVSLTCLVAILASIPIAVAQADDKPRVFITDSHSWEVRGGAGGADGTFGSSTAGGARPQTAEIVKTFGERCPSVVTNNIQAKANYIVVLDHEGGKAWLAHKNKVAVFDAVSGDSVISKSTLSLGGSVEEACNGISKHWATHKTAVAPESDKAPSSTPTQPTEVKAAIGSRLSISSIPDGADIEVDGNFVGNTPSAIEISIGDHTISVRKNGYKAWQRKLKASGGDVSLKAELEKEGGN